MFKNNKQVVIAVMGPKGSGKDTFADFAVREYGATGKIMTARHLKQLCADVFGLKFQDLNENKDVPFIKPISIGLGKIRKIIAYMRANIPQEDLPLEFDRVGIQQFEGIVFKTPRELLQYVGTDLMQKMYKPFHCTKAYGEYKGKNGVWLITDMRFVHEYEYAKKIFPTLYTVRIVGRNEVPDGDEEHASEREWKEIPMFCIVDNDKEGLDNFYKNCELVLEMIKEDLEPTNKPKEVSVNGNKGKKEKEEEKRKANSPVSDV